MSRDCIVAFAGLFLACGPAQLPKDAEPNRPPRIIPATVQPASVDVVWGPNCPLPFSVNVEDPDVNDRIRNRWFVFAPSQQPMVSFDGEMLPGDIGVIRGQAVTAPQVLAGPASGLTQNGEHRLMLVVSDGEFIGGMSTVPRTRTLADGGTIQDPTYTDSVVWVVKTDSLLACP